MFVESCWFHLLSRTQIDWWTKKCNTQAMYGTLVPFGEHSFMWLPQKCCKPSKDLFWWMYPCYFHGSPSCSQPSDVRLGVRLGTIHWFFSGHRPRCPHYFFVVHLVWYVWYLLWPLRNLNKLLCEPPHQLAHSETLIFNVLLFRVFFQVVILPDPSRPIHFDTAALVRQVLMAPSTAPGTQRPATLSPWRRPFLQLPRLEEKKGRLILIILWYCVCMY